jgi:hypothetical protein
MFPFLFSIIKPVARSVETRTSQDNSRSPLGSITVGNSAAAFVNKSKILKERGECDSLFQSSNPSSRFVCIVHFTVYGEDIYFGLIAC